jgi:hypothetical protein
MKKLALTAVIAFTIGTLSLVNMIIHNKTVPVKTAKFMVDNRNYSTLATAD